MLIIGITGTLGAGKGTIVDYLISKRNFKHYSVSDFLKEGLSKQKRPIDRTSMQNIGNELREKYGPDYITRNLFRIAQKANQNSIIESIRNPKEAEFIKSNGGILIAVDANIKTRYERIKTRGSEKDSVTFEEFKKQEERELQSTDPNAQNLPRCIEKADYKIDNDGDLNSLYEQVDKIIK